MTTATRMAYRQMIRPGSIVIVGASNNRSKPGGSVTRNIMESDFSGDLYLVNRNGEQIGGRASYPRVEDLPDGIELAIIAIPAKGVYSEIGKLSAKNCKTIMVLTAGFGETDEQGKAEEKRLVDYADRQGVTLIGPNCVGIISPHYGGKFAGIMPRLKKGGIDVVSASGATVDYLMEQAETRGLRFENVISCGNSAQTGVEDIIAMMDEQYDDAAAKVKMIYLEGIKKPAKLLRHARSLTRKGCILLGIKSGVTDDGMRAAASHTGAMATSDTVVQALFDKAGILRVKSKHELVEIGCALAALNNRTDIQKICIITDAGGPGVMLSDELNRHGLVLPRLKAATQKRIAGCLPRHATATNPVDCLPTQTGKQISDVIDILVDEGESIDAIIVLTGNSMLFDKWESYQEILRSIEKSPIPVLPVLSSVTTCQPLLERFKQAGRTFFVDEVNVGTALGRIHHRRPVYDPDDALENYDKKKLAAILDGREGVLPPETCDELLVAAGFNPPESRIIKTRSELGRVSQNLRWPVVVKVIGALHKSEVGGVITGVEDASALERAWDRLSAIDRFEGVLVQEMIPGPEVIIGAKQEPGYGHLLLFGLGGIFTEILKDSQFALAPLGFRESADLIRRIRSIKVLEGARGQKGMSLSLLADYLTRLGRLVGDFPQLSEVDFNPVKGEGENLYVVDCRMIIQRSMTR